MTRYRITHTSTRYVGVSTLVGGTDEYRIVAADDSATGDAKLVAHLHKNRAQRYDGFHASSMGTASETAWLWRMAIDGKNHYAVQYGSESVAPETLDAYKFSSVKAARDSFRRA